MNNNIKNKTMKFSKTERQLHQPNYNPPCNVYETSSKLKNNIVTGSLAGPAHIDRNTFGYGDRFLSNKDKNPGPGTYQMLKENKDSKKSQGQVMKGPFLYSIENASVSIPYTYFGQNAEDQEQKEYIRQLEMKEDLLKSVKALKTKQPAFTFTKSQKKLSYLKESIGEPQPPEEKEPIDRKTNILWKEKIKQSSDRRRQIINKINPDFIPSLELIEIMKKRKQKPIPGPGFYGKIDEEEEYINLLQMKKGVSFTAAQRFPSDKQSMVGPGLYNVLHKKAQTQMFSFGREKRNAFDKKQLGNFRFYHENNRDGYTSQLRSKSCAFGHEVRFKEEKIPESPIEKKQNVKMEKMIKTRIARHKKLSKSEEDQGLLGISTMASTIE